MSISERRAEADKSVGRAMFVDFCDSLTDFGRKNTGYKKVIRSRRNFMQY